MCVRTQLGMSFIPATMLPVLGVPSHCCWIQDYEYVEFQCGMAGDIQQTMVRRSPDLPEGGVRQVAVSEHIHTKAGSGTRQVQFSSPLALLSSPRWGFCQPHLPLLYLYTSCV